MVVRKLKTRISKLISFMKQKTLKHSIHSSFNTASLNGFSIIAI